MTYDVLDFLRTFLNMPYYAMRPQGAYDYGAVRSSVLHREGQFQVELFTILPRAGFPHEHRHPHVDTVEVGVHGVILLTRNGRLATPRPYKHENNSIFWIIRIRSTDWHGAQASEVGGSFLSVQHWVDAVPPTSVGLDWEGELTSPEHAVTMQAYRGFHVVQEKEEGMPASPEHEGRRQSYAS